MKYTTLTTLATLVFTYAAQASPVQAPADVTEGLEKRATHCMNFWTDANFGGLHGRQCVNAGVCSKYLQFRIPVLRVRSGNVAHSIS